MTVSQWRAIQDEGSGCTYLSRKEGPLAGLDGIRPLITVAGISLTWIVDVEWVPQPSLFSHFKKRDFLSLGVENYNSIL